MRRGIVSSREHARAEIEAGRVLVGGAPAPKAARLVGPGEAIRLLGPPPRFVSRGGEKLEAALERFAIDVRDRRAIDAGASTGGFTDCLLQRGAREVVALDVGHGQLHERLRADPRVHNVERTNLRQVDVPALGGPAQIVVADLSFISLRLVADRLLALAVPGAPIVVLVKPQFEAGRAEAGRGRGVITDPAVWRRVLDEVIAAFRDRGAIIMGVMVSPLPGSDGNVEFLVHLTGTDTTPPASSADTAVAGPGPVDDDALDLVVAEATGLRAD